MTEALMSTNASIKPGYGELPFDRRIDYRLKSGRGIFGVKLSIVDDTGQELPHDGATFGHLRVKGPWIASGYLKDDSALDRDGYLKTGDMAVIDPEGYVTLTDRSKDVISRAANDFIGAARTRGRHPAVLPPPSRGSHRNAERPLRAWCAVTARASRRGFAHLAPSSRNGAARTGRVLDALPMTRPGEVHQLRCASVQRITSCMKPKTSRPVVFRSVKLFEASILAAAYSRHAVGGAAPARFFRLRRP